MHSFAMVRSRQQASAARARLHVLENVTGLKHHGKCLTLVLASLMVLPALRSDYRPRWSPASEGVLSHHGCTLRTTVRTTSAGASRPIGCSDRIEAHDLFAPVLRPLDATLLAVLGILATQPASPAAG